MDHNDSSPGHCTNEKMSVENDMLHKDQISNIFTSTDNWLDFMLQLGEVFISVVMVLLNHLIYIYVYIYIYIFKEKT